jgi:hypothetical protein
MLPTLRNLAQEFRIRLLINALTGQVPEYFTCPNAIHRDLANDFRVAHNPPGIDCQARR